METTEVIGIGREAIWTVIYVAGRCDHCTVGGSDYWRISSGHLHSGNDAELYPQIGGFGCGVTNIWRLATHHFVEMFISIFDMIPQIFTR